MPRVLELGCGEIPTLEEGWEHLDLRPFPHIEYVQSAADLSNFADCSYDRIVTKDMIEHLGWREVPHALREWLRVARVVDIETTNADELALILTDPKHPLCRPWGHDSGDWMYFNRVAYGHQDYPENTHRSYWTPEWLQELLLEAGATEVRLIREDTYRFRMEASR